MSGVANGQDADEISFNNALMARNGDTDTVGIVSLLSTAPASGASIANTQGFINHLADTDGTSEGDANAKNYSSNNYISNGDDRKTAIEKLDVALDLVQVDLDLAELAIIDHEGRISTLESNNTQDVTLGVVGATPAPEGASLVGQLLTLQPADASNPGLVSTLSQTFAGDKTFQDDVVIDGDLTVNGTTTTVNSTVLEVTDPNIVLNNGGNDASSEGSGLTIERTSTNGSLIFDSSLASKFKSGLLGSENELLVRNALFELFGELVMTSSFTAKDRFALEVVTSNISGANAVMPSSGASVKKLTNGALVSIEKLSSFISGQMVFGINATGNEIILKNLSGSPAQQQIETGTGADLAVRPGGAFLLIHDGTNWKIMSGSGGSSGFKKYPLSFSDFADASTSKTITLATVQNKMIKNVLVRHTTAVAGGALSGYSFKVGITGQLDRFALDHDSFVAPSSTTHENYTVNDIPEIGVPFDIKVTATSVGDNLDQAITGNFEVHIEYAEVN